MRSRDMTFPFQRAVKGDLQRHRTDMRSLGPA
jgi:hypothetical protein